MCRSGGTDDSSILERRSAKIRAERHLQKIVRRIVSIDGYVAVAMS